MNPIRLFVRSLPAFLAAQLPITAEEKWWQMAWIGGVYESSQSLHLSSAREVRIEDHSIELLKRGLIEEILVTECAVDIGFEKRQ